MSKIRRYRENFKYKSKVAATYQSCNGHLCGTFAQNYKIRGNAAMRCEITARIPPHNTAGIREKTKQRPGRGIAKTFAQFAFVRDLRVPRSLKIRMKRYTVTSYHCVIKSVPMVKIGAEVRLTSVPFRLLSVPFISILFKPRWQQPSKPLRPP